MNSVTYNILVWFPAYWFFQQYKVKGEGTPY